MSGTDARKNVVLEVVNDSNSTLNIRVELVDGHHVFRIDRADPDDVESYDGPLQRGMVFDHGGSATELHQRIVVVATPGTLADVGPDGVAFVSFSVKAPYALRFEPVWLFRRKVADGGPIEGLEPTSIVAILDRATPASWWARGFPS